MMPQPPDEEGPQLDLSKFIHDLRENSGQVAQSDELAPESDEEVDAPASTIAWGKFAVVCCALIATSVWLLATCWNRGWLAAPLDLRNANWDTWHFIVLGQFLATVAGLVCNRIWFGRSAPIPDSAWPTLAILSLVFPVVVCCGVWTIVLLTRFQGRAPSGEYFDSTQPTRHFWQQFPHRWWIVLGLFELVCLWLLLTRVGLPETTVTSLEGHWVSSAAGWHARLTQLLAGLGLVQVLIGGFAIATAAAEDGDSQLVTGLVGALVPLVGLSPLAAHVAILYGLQQLPEQSPWIGTVLSLSMIWGVIGLCGVWYVVTNWDITRDAALLVCLGYFLLVPYFALEIEQRRSQAEVPDLTAPAVTP